MHAAEQMPGPPERRRRSTGARATIDQRAATRLAAVVGDGEFGEQDDAAGELRPTSAGQAPDMAGSGAAGIAAMAAALACLWAGNAAIRGSGGFVAHAALPHGSLTMTRASGGPMFGPAHGPGAAGGDTAMKVRDSMRAAAVATGMLTAGVRAGDAVQWRVEDGGNGHWYSVTPIDMTWPDLRDWCASHGGHLATITNTQEWNWVKQTLAFTNRFVGAYQDHADAGYAEPIGGWKWVTGEPFVYATYMGMDDCPGGLEGSCGCVGDGNQDVLFYTGCCNNELDDIGDGIAGGCDSNSRGGVMEWSADCNSDGIVDYGQIRDGTLADANANGVPDSCECDTNPSLPPCCPGDIYRNGRVDGADLGALLSEWGPVTPLTNSDLDGNGQVNGADLGILLANWGPCGG